MDFEEVLELSRKVEREFQLIENKPWTVETQVIELSKQVGDLCKVVLNGEGYYLLDRKEKRGYIADKENIANELADIFHQLIKISDYYDIDLLKAHIEAREGEERYIKIYKEKFYKD